MKRNLAIGVGQSTTSNPYRRGREAALSSLEKIGSLTPSVALVHGIHRGDAMEVFRGVRGELHSCALIGCLSQRPAAGDGPLSGGKTPSAADTAGGGLQVIVMASPHIKAKVGVGRVIHGDWEHGLAEAFQKSYIKGSMGADGDASRVKSLGDWYLYRKPSMALVVMTSRPAEIRQREKAVMSFLHRKFRGKVPVMIYSFSPEGGLPLLIADDMTLREGVAMAIFKTDLQYSIERFHNYEPLGAKFFATRLEGRRVFELNNRPAMVEYRQTVSGVEGGGLDDTGWFSRYPLAYRGREGRYHLFFPETVHEDFSFTLPHDHDPDVPLFPMTVIRSPNNVFLPYGAAGGSAAASPGGLPLIMRDTELADLSLDEGAAPANGAVEIRSIGCFKAFLPDEPWESERSHLAMVIKNEMDPLAEVSAENARLLTETLRLKELNDLVFDGIGYGIALHHKKDGVIHDNQTYQRMMLLSSRSEGNCAWADREKGPCGVCIVDKAFRDRTFAGAEVNLSVDGVLRCFRIDAFPLLNAQSESESVIEVIRDISEVKRLQESLEAEKRKMETVVLGLAESIYIVDRNFGLHFFHRGALNLPAKDGVYREGSPCYEIIFNRAAPCTWCRVADTFANGEVIRCIANLKTAGDEHYYQITHSPWEDARGMMAICLVVDTTTQHRLEQQIIKSEKLSSLAVLSAGMAHELNNPLGAINFNLETAKKREKDPFITDLLDGIRKDVMRINKIVGNLLSFARAGSRAYQAVPLPKVFDLCLDLLGPVLEKKAVVLQRRYDDNLPSIHGNLQDLQQVFINLFGNAIDAMPSGGTLTVSAESVSGNEGAGPKRIEVIVADSGIGIPPENLNRIFDPFFTTKPENEGTGLGLSVVHKIVEIHGATINVRSYPGQGTTFTLSFPISRQDAAARGPLP